MNDYSPEQLTDVADLCREAHDNILVHGWKPGGTHVGAESSGLCLGSAFALAAQLEPWNTVLDWRQYAGSRDVLCGNGLVLRDYATRNGAHRSPLCHWNDSEERTVDQVLDLLQSCEKAMRDDAAKGAR